jgi:hypothetical protein
MPLFPLSSVDFMKRYADTCQDPAVFYGITPQGCPDPPALVQVLRRRPVWDYLGVRHLLGPSPDEIRTAIAAADPPLSDFIAVPVTGSIRFPVVVRSDASSVDVFLGTAGRINYGAVKFDLRNANGNTVIHAQLDGSKLPVQDWAIFARDAGASIPRGIYTADVTFEAARPESAVVLWKDQIRPGSYRHRVRIENGGLKLAFLSPDDHVAVWENQSVQPLVYVAPQSGIAASGPEAQAKLVAQLDLHRVAYVEPGTRACDNNASFPADRTGSELRSIAIAPNRVDADVAAHSAGTVVYVGSYDPGWMARIDGKPARTFRVNGTFLGACVAEAGSHRVTFEYRPSLWYPSLAASVLGLLVAVIGLRWREARAR